VVKTLSTMLDAMADWLGRGFQAVIPEVLIVGAVVFIVVAWWILARWYQRCPHCRRVVRRAHTRSLRCSRCGRQYYYGLRPMR